MKRRRHVYLIGSVAFVCHPTLRGVWLRTDASVFTCACGYCGAKKGQLCRNTTNGKPHGSTHSARRRDATHIRRRLARENRRPKTTIVHMLLK